MKKIWNGIKKVFAFIGVIAASVFIILGLKKKDQTVKVKASDDKLKGVKHGDKKKYTDI